MVLEGLHDDAGLTRFQAIIDEDNSEDGESVPFDSLCNRVSGLSRCQILVCEVDNWVLYVFNK